MIPMTAKRLILTAITLVMVFLVGADLVSSWGKPQFASRLGLYETDLRLHLSEWQGDDLPASLQQQVQQAMQEKEPLLEALKSYRDVRDRAGKTFSQELSQMSALRTKLADQSENDSSAIAALTQQISKQEIAIDELDLRIGILQAAHGETVAAVNTWKPMVPKRTIVGKTAQSLTQLWGQKPTAADEVVLTQGLNGWFRYRALRQHYQITQQADAQAALERKERIIAAQSVTKLGITGAISIGSVLIGTALLLFVLGQRFLGGQTIGSNGSKLVSPKLASQQPSSLKSSSPQPSTPKPALLAGVNQSKWTVPWDWELIWQVLIVGFFLMGQVVVPLVLQSGQAALGFSAASLSERGRALWMLLGYLALAGGGLAVMYGSIKPNLPLAENWFNLDFKSPWIRWGLGGYFVAFPIVVGVSLINAQIWQGQGGSNPILAIAAQNQDPVALLLIFITAAIAAPFYEETLFRGFLLPSLTRYMPTWGAIALSSFLFAVVHLSLSEVLPLMALAMVLGFVYSRTQNLLASMLLHSLWNSGTLISLFLLGGAQ
jgi:uncharacterized protein